MSKPYDINQCILCGYDMHDAMSKAGRGDIMSVNLNSMTQRMMLEMNPERCRRIYIGEEPSYFGEGPTVQDCGTFIIPEDPNQEPIMVSPGSEERVPLNIYLQKEGGGTVEQQMPQMPSMQFGGALAPQYHDNAQPTGGGMLPFVPMPNSPTPGPAYAGYGVSNGGFNPNMVYNHGIPMGQPAIQEMDRHKLPLTQYKTNVYGNEYMYYPPDRFMDLSIVRQLINPYGYQIHDPNNPPDNGEEPVAMEEWEAYQRTYGFLAPIPTDTDFPEPGLFSGFAKGFDPHQELVEGEDDFYDATLLGRIGIAEAFHEFHLSQYANRWGYAPGMIINRRENFMFPGINEYHHVPVPSNSQVYDHLGRPQQMIPGTPQPNGQPQNPMVGATPIMATQLPVGNMVATNPYMQGATMVGGYPMNQQQPLYQAGKIPTPYMQARYNYAIANGFQSVQEMDRNDFLVLKIISRAVNHSMTDEEFQNHFEKNYCRRFTDIYERDRKIENEKMAVERRLWEREEKEKHRIDIKVKIGDRVVAERKAITPTERTMYGKEVEAMCPESKRSNAERRAEHLAYLEHMAKVDYALGVLHANAPEREYDHKSWQEFVLHGFSEVKFYQLDFQHWLWQNSSNRYLVENEINTTEYMRNCMERGMGFGTPAAHSRLAFENLIYWVKEDFPDPNLAHFIRGAYGKYPNGLPLQNYIAPLYAYITIADPKNPDRSIPFPKFCIENTYKEFVKFANYSLQRSKEPFHIQTYDEFEELLGVRVMDDQEFLNEYGDYAPAAKYIRMAKEGVRLKEKGENILDRLKDPEEWKYATVLRDHAKYAGYEHRTEEEEYGDPNGDVPTDEILRQIDAGTYKTGWRPIPDTKFIDDDDVPPGQERIKEADPAELEHPEE